MRKNTLHSQNASVCSESVWIERTVPWGLLQSGREYMLWNNLRGYIKDNHKGEKQTQECWLHWECQNREGKAGETEEIHFGFGAGMIFIT